MQIEKIDNRKLVSERIKKIKPYLFAKIEETREKLQKEGKDIIDLTIGDPDIPTPKEIVEKMKEELQNPENFRYPPYQGILSLREEFCSWYEKRFGVKFDPRKNCWTLIGSKEGIALLHMAILNEGDISVIPSPGYPVYSVWTQFAGGNFFLVKLEEEKSFLPDIEAIKDVLERAKLMWVCYPNNPTSATATEDFYEKLGYYSKKFGFIVAVDMAYSEIYVNKKPISFFQVVRNGVKAIEFHSWSKTFCMTGWRIGMAVGDEEIISALGKIKTNTDSGVFMAIQKTAEFALKNYDKITPKIREIYSERRKVMEDALQKAGIKFVNSDATFYIWARVGNGEEFVLNLLEKGVMVTPGGGFGIGGEEYIRISLTSPRIFEASEIIKHISFS